MAPTLPSPAVFSADAARDLLQAFDVADDPDTQAFLADLLASGTVPHDEVDALFRVSGGRPPPSATRSTTNAEQVQSQRSVQAEAGEVAKRDKDSQRSSKDKEGKRGKKGKKGPRTGKKHKGVRWKEDRSPFFRNESRAADGDPDGGSASEETTPESDQPPAASRTAPNNTRTVAVFTTRTVFLGDTTPSSDDASRADRPVDSSESRKRATKTNEAACASSDMHEQCTPGKTSTLPTKQEERMAPSLYIGASPSVKSPGSAACLSWVASPCPPTTPQANKKRATTSHFFTPPSSRRKKTSSEACSLDNSCDDDDDSEAGDATPATPSKRPAHLAKVTGSSKANNANGPSRTAARTALARRPFTALTAPRFGLVQEQLAHDPFWLLVALVFLVRVAGAVSLPVFWRVKARYPTPHALAAADPRALEAAMHHLGLAAVRCAAIQRYARDWLAQPPRPGVCTAVRNYPLPPEAEEENFEEDKQEANLTRRKNPAAASCWEIGHLTQGAYAVDSWRIFCRDMFLGRSTDWQGTPCPWQQRPGVCNTGTTFQPEWMRVLPRDKELRACLRWMWMREGWDWDPRTGDRTVLREELRQAVNAGRVWYDARGQLTVAEAAAAGQEEAE
ncbi:pre-mRNA splicing factor [Niveomyces insectorum RCEF 264]|uniref:Pre-mRNA splicing factor n=1 Tax=Niveomyces insectorum RCEF 264 TaxID=1081102 RepID=A0A167VJW8_9HYPO|nr:pre-mRNA splicing factor [Niveomyces insectorum RCEF 264]